MRSIMAVNELLMLMKVSKATYKDYLLLKIDSIPKLAKACPDELYLRLQAMTASRHDPCVWDIFPATINEARTGEKQSWWEWSKVRKKREIEGTFIKKP